MNQAILRQKLEKLRSASGLIYEQKDKLWALIWFSGLLVLWIWDLLFLNAPALSKFISAFFNTFLIGFLVIIISLILGWLSAMAGHYAQWRLKGWLSLPFDLILNLFRSIPQILGILFGYVFITRILEESSLGAFSVILLISLVISLFVFLEINDLMIERISHFQKTDFYNAMRVCGIPEFRIINFDILFKNSWIHIYNKMIAVFGMTIFLICSVDFIISVGLSLDVSSVNLPATLGSMLAQIDSKQDILAIGTTLTDPLYLPNLFFTHLQGVSVAFVIVFSLLCIFKISDGFARRYHI